MSPLNYNPDDPDRCLKLEAIYLPSVITSDKWRNIKKAAEKKGLKKKAKRGKVVTKIKKQKKDILEVSSEEDGEVNYAESDESEWNDLSDSNDDVMIGEGNTTSEKGLIHRERKEGRCDTDDTSSESDLPLNLCYYQI
ncbi:hypothetical protein ACJJTC_002807 [Scirpophaga incertulas]